MRYLVDVFDRPQALSGREMRFGPRLDEAARIGTAAFKTGTVASSECGRFVKEEEFGVATGLHEFAAAALEFEQARDPALACPTANRKERLFKGVKAPATVSEHRAAPGVGVYLTEGVNPIL